LAARRTIAAWRIHACDDSIGHSRLPTAVAGVSRLRRESVIRGRRRL